MDFKSFYTTLNEALISFGGKKNGQVIIICGASGSGKSLVSKYLLNLSNYKVLDVDYLKSLLIRSPHFQTKYPELKNVDFKNPEHVKMVHDISNKENLDVKVISTLKKSIGVQNKETKTNLVFDITLKSMDKLKEVSETVQEMGYSKEDISVVWVLAPLEVAKQQNLKRSRVVPEEILTKIHFAVAETMKQIIRNDALSRQYMDGFVYIMFNLAGIDTILRTSTTGGKFLEKVTYVKVKDPGKPIEAEKGLTQEVVEKIKKYIPTDEF